MGFLAFQAFAYYRQANFDGMNTCIGLALAVLGIRRAVGQDHDATQQVSVKLDEAHGAVVAAHEAIARTENKVDAIVAASSDSIPTMKAGPIP